MLLSANLPYPRGFHATTQFFVNSQLYYIARRAAPRHAVGPSRGKRTTARPQGFDLTLKSRQFPDEDEEHKTFTIWFESDNADVKTLRRKFGERISVMGTRDVYISVVYANSEKKWSRVENAAAHLYQYMNRHVDAGTCRNSLGVLRIETPSPYNGVKDIIVEAHLLRDGPSVRIAEFHFGSDSCFLNEWVIDENGIRYPHRNPPPPLPKRTNRSLARLLVGN